MNRLIVCKLEPGHAASLVACFRACYGDTYANETFYDVALIRRRINDGSLRSVVAVDGDRVVGHTGLTVNGGGALAAEAGNTVVHPEMRGHGLLGRLGQALRERTIDDGYVGYVHYPTTAHDIMQKSATSGTGRETGIMLAYIPTATDYADFASGDGRLAATIVYQPLAPAPAARIYLPHRYADLVRQLAASLGLQREFLDAGTSDSGASDWQIEHLPLRGLTRLTLNATGGDLATVLAGQLIDAQPVVHLDISMDDPAIDGAVAAACAQGFRYCGWLPYFSHSDVLRMQRVVDINQRELAPAVVTTAAAQLLAGIIADG